MRWVRTEYQQDCCKKLATKLWHGSLSGSENNQYCTATWRCALRANIRVATDSCLRRSRSRGYSHGGLTSPRPVLQFVHLFLACRYCASWPDREHSPMSEQSRNREFVAAVRRRDKPPLWISVRNDAGGPIFCRQRVSFTKK